MSKKTFKNNPALQFISAADPEAEEEQSQELQPETAPKVTYAAEEPAEHKQDTPPAGYKVDPRFIEKRTHRLQVILQPSLYENIKSIAMANKISVNEYIHKALQNAVNNDTTQKGRIQE